MPPTFAVSPASQWAGGTVLVRSPFFDGLDSLPTVTAAGIEMFVTRVDDSTLSATLPSIPTQTAAVEVIDGATRYPVGTVGIVGFRTHWVGAPAAFGNPVMIHATGGPFGLAGIVPQPVSGAVGIVALGERRVIEAPGVRPVDAGMLRGVGVTYDSSRYILRDSAGVIAVWQLIPPLTRVDTVPSIFQNPNSREIVRLSANVWLETHNHVTGVVRPGAPTIAVTLEDPWHYTLSVPADRAIVSGGYGAAGAVVFEMSTGDTLYRLPLSTVGGAAFTADGTTLYAVSGTFSGNLRVLSANAATGSVNAEAPLPVGSQPLGMTLAGSETLILVAVQADSVPEILVYDVGTMGMIGRLLAPDSTDSSECCWLDASIIADDASSTAYVMGAGGYVWEFDLLP